MLIVLTEGLQCMKMHVPCLHEEFRTYKDIVVIYKVKKLITHDVYSYAVTNGTSHSSVSDEHGSTLKKVCRCEYVVQQNTYTHPVYIFA